LVRKTVLVEAILNMQIMWILKTETDDLDGKSSKSYAFLKKNGTENGLPMLELCHF
jgi:hypothetical protein